MMRDARAAVTDRPAPRCPRRVRDGEVSGRHPGHDGPAEATGKRWLRVTAGLLWAPEIEASVAPRENECMR